MERAKEKDMLMLTMNRLRTVVAGALLWSTAGASALVLSASPAFATTAVTLYVAVGGAGDCATSPCSLIQTAVTAAEGSYSGDDVTIDVAAGTYTENVTINAPSLDSLTIVGAGANSTIVNGGGVKSVFSLSSGTVHPVTLSGLTITNGSGDFSSPNYYGGGIFDNAPSALTVTDSTLSYNVASSGSNGYGGGIENNNSGTVNVINSTLLSNTASGTNGGNGGGGIYNRFSGAVNVLGSTLSGNHVTLSSGGSAYGAGIYNGSGTLNVTDSTLSGNYVTLSNGGYAYGAGIYSSSGTLNVTDSTLSGNYVTLGSSGVAHGAGIYNTGGTLNLGASIVAGNSSGGNCSGTVTTSGYNLSDDSSCVVSSPSSHDQVVTSGSVNLGSLANNGGPTQTLLPGAGSPAIGAIPLNTTLNSTSGPVAVCPRTDQRGVASSGYCTIGAVEVRLPAQTISFTSSVPAATVGGSYTPTATSSSLLAVSITVDSASSGICSISGAVVSFVQAGTCTLDANQAGSANFSAAPQVQQVLTVAAAVGSPQLLAQAPLTLTSTDGVVGTPLTLDVTGGSGAGALRYLFVNTNSASCALSGDVLSATTVGYCTILVFKGGDARYLAAITSPTTVTFTSPAPATIIPALSTQAPLTLTSTRGVAGTPLTLHAAGGSGTGTLTFALTRPGSAQCTLHANTLTAQRPGTCAITLTKAGDATYLAASAGTSNVTFTRAFFATRVLGIVKLNARSQVTITGSGFYNKPSITSNDSRTSAVVIHDHGTSLVVRVTARRGAATGTHEFTITLANGKSCRVKYLAR